MLEPKRHETPCCSLDPLAAKHADRAGQVLPFIAESLAGIGLPVRAELLSLFAAGAAAAWRNHWNLSYAAPSESMPALVRGRA